MDVIEKGSSQNGSVLFLRLICVRKMYKRQIIYKYLKSVMQNKGKCDKIKGTNLFEAVLFFTALLG